MRLLVLITTAIRRDDGTVAGREAVHDRGAHTPRGRAASDDSGVDAMRDQPRLERRLVKNRWRRFNELENVLIVPNARVELSAGMPVIKAAIIE